MFFKSVFLVESFLTAVAGERLVVKLQVFVEVMLVMEPLLTDVTEDKSLVILLSPPPVSLVLFLRGSWGGGRIRQHHQQ